MPYVKGAPGRPKGAINRVNTKFVDYLDKIGFNIVEELNERYLSALADDNQELAVTILAIMSKYVYPTLKAIEIKQERVIDTMTSQQKIEALKNAVKLLEAKNND